jgi:hypothetical protein
MGRGSQQYWRRIWVRQACDGTWVDERKVKCLGISEDFEGRDELEFECPACGKPHQSLRVSGSQPG